MGRKVIILTESDITRFWSFVDRRGPDDCWNWIGCPTHRYGNFSVGARKIAKTYLAHRIAYLLTHGHTDLLVCHSCDNTRCMNPAHLFAGTHADNNRDCREKGRFLLGEDHGKSVLTNRQVCYIVSLADKGIPRKEIAKRMKVSRQTVGNILTGRGWSWLTGINQ